MNKLKHECLKQKVEVTHLLKVKQLTSAHVLVNISLACIY